MGYNPWGHTESNTTEPVKAHRPSDVSSRGRSLLCEHHLGKDRMHPLCLQSQCVASMAFCCPSLLGSLITRTDPILACPPILQCSASREAGSSTS